MNELTNTTDFTSQLAEIRAQRAKQYAIVKTQKDENEKRENREKKYWEYVEKASHIFIQGITLQAQFAICPLFLWMNPLILEKAVLWAGPLIVKACRKHHPALQNVAGIDMINILENGIWVAKSLNTPNLIYQVSQIDAKRILNKIKSQDMERNIDYYGNQILLARHVLGIYAENQPLDPPQEQLDHFKMLPLRSIYEEQLGMYGIAVVWLNHSLYDQWWERIEPFQSHMILKLKRGNRQCFAMVANPSLPNEIMGNIMMRQMTINENAYHHLQLNEAHGLKGVQAKEARQVEVSCCIVPKIRDSTHGKGIVLEQLCTLELASLVDTAEEYETILKTQIEKHRFLYQHQIIYIHVHDVILPMRVIELYAKDGNLHHIVNICNTDVSIDILTRKDAFQDWNEALMASFRASFTN